MSAVAYSFTENAVYGEDEKRWSPTKRKIGDLLDAFVAVVHLPESRVDALVA